MITSTDTLTKMCATGGVGAAGASYTYLGLPLGDLVGLFTIGLLAAQLVQSVINLVKSVRQSRTDGRKPNEQGV